MIELHHKIVEFKVLLHKWKKEKLFFFNYLLFCFPELPDDSINKYYII